MFNLQLILVTLMVYSTLGDPPTACRPGFVRNLGSCYFFVRELATFGEATAFCNQFSSRLATITSQDESDFITNYLQNNGENRGYFAGGTDLREPNVWSWEHPRRGFTFTNWHSSQPNNDPNENCLVLWPGFGYKWADLNCGSKQRFVCEAQLVAD